ncbi:uncharacterized protein Pvf1 [Prorops nasuta]|uniref:uncharacterized protein Pvf1 n=1 Tax=Prorops nasuta TaxID=863751 RepID=UPI0034CEBD6C
MNILCFGTTLLIFGLVFAQVLSQFRSGYEDDDAIVFPGPVGRACHAATCKNNISVGLELARRLNSIDSIDEFYNLLQGRTDPDSSVTYTLQTAGFAGRIGETGERSNAEIARPAKCIPELQPVPIKSEHDMDHSVIYYPSCTRVKRCGGCCSHPLLSCQPIATEIKNFEVIVSRVDEDMRLSLRGKEIVPIEEHTKCRCDCRIKQEDCTEKQVYLKDECRCACSNVDEEEKCKNSNDTKLWEPDACTCLCRNYRECTTGFYFDQNTCSCKEVPLYRKFFGNSRRTGYRFTQTERPESVPPVIVTLDAGDPRRKPKEDPEK